MLDLVLKGGRVVDGTGLPSFVADVAVTDGRIVEVGRVAGRARTVRDVSSLVVAPGFIDIHTHYDAQLSWDPAATPSSWHGVTTVLTGNCGFTLAPSRPGDREWLARMLSRVEGMSAEALLSGVRFEAGGFGDFLASVEGRIGVNLAAYVGHSAVRRHVMGEAASERAATAGEIAAMQDLVRAAMREGAIGFSSSQLDIHVAHDGRGVPSNFATPEEVVALCSVLAEFGRGAIEFIPRTFLEGYDEADRALLLEMYRASGRPIEVNQLVYMPYAPDGWKRALEFCEQAGRSGGRIYPQFASNELGAHFALGSTFLFDEMPVFRDALVLPSPERERRLRDPRVREEMRRALADPTGRAFVFVWEIVSLESVVRDEHRQWLGRSVAEIADETGRDRLDCFLDLSLEGDLETQFVLKMPPMPEVREATETLIRSPRTMAGSSDAGAHLLSFVGADYTTRLLTDWVPDVISLEQAVARLTSMPAAVHGFADRGVIREGAAADLVLFDPTRLRVGATRLVRDLPGGSARYVVDAEGYVATYVNGVALLEEGTYTGTTPGHVLR
jgi:N-acyl-D-aspartate/D-glutamate deacylase